MRSWLFLAAVVIFACSFAWACGGGEPTSVSREIRDDEESVIRLGDDVTVRVPRGALPGGTVLTITRSGSEAEAPPNPPEGGKAAGSAFEIDTSGRKLARPVSLEIRYDAKSLPADLSGESVFLAFFDGEKNQWVPVGGEVDAERNVISLETEHLSWWSPWTWWLDALKATLYSALTADPWQIYDTATAYSGCNSAPEILIDPARANNIVDACFESGDGDHPNLRLINRKVFTVQFDPVGSNSQRVGFASALKGPRGKHSFQADFNGLYFGDTVEVAASSNSLTFGVDIVLWALRIIPGGNLIPFDTATELANEISKDPIVQPAIDLWARGDYSGAILKVGEIFVTREFAELLVRYLSKIVLEDETTKVVVAILLRVPVEWVQELFGVIKLLLIPAAVIAVTDAVTTGGSLGGFSGTMVFASNKARPPECPLPDDIDRGFCQFALEVGQAAERNDLDWFVNNALLAPCPPGGGIGSDLQGAYCSSDPCMPIGSLGSEAACVSVESFRQHIRSALDQSVRLFGVVYPETGIFEGNSRDDDEGPLMLLGGGQPIRAYVGGSEPRG